MAYLQQESLVKAIERRAEALQVTIEARTAERWVSFRLEGHREHALYARADGPEPCLAPTLSAEDWQELLKEVESTDGYQSIEREGLPESGQGWVRPQILVPDPPGLLLEKLIDQALVRADTGASTTPETPDSASPPSSTPTSKDRGPFAKALALGTKIFGGGLLFVVAVIGLFIFICCGALCYDISNDVHDPYPDDWPRRFFTVRGEVLEFSSGPEGVLVGVINTSERVVWDATGERQIVQENGRKGRLHVYEYGDQAFEDGRYKVSIDKCSSIDGSGLQELSPKGSLVLISSDGGFQLEVDGCGGWSGTLYQEDQFDLIDSDQDGIPSEQECAWNDSSIVEADRNADQDCDGVSNELDCDPQSSAVATSRDDDQDCDGLLNEDDCDPTGANGFVDDLDCDGVVDDNDCDPKDSENIKSREADLDCDGISNSEDCAPEDEFNATVGCQLPWVSELDKACEDYDNAKNDIQEGQAVQRGRKIYERARVKGQGTLYNLSSVDVEATFVTAEFRIQNHFFKVPVYKGTASYGVLANISEGECVAFSVSNLQIDAILDRSHVCPSFTGNRTFTSKLLSLSECDG